jgi:Leucine-rich repeat (LRR) protein
MKNLKTMTLALLFFLACNFTSINIQAQTITFTDSHFKAVLVANPNIDLDGDGEIQKSEAEVFAGPLDVSYSSIFDLSGIEHFTSLAVLDCSHNTITNLNLSKNLGLVRVVCNNNSLQTLDVADCTELRMLDCNTNSLSVIDLRTNNLMEYLECSYNLLNALDLNANEELRILNCSSNHIDNLDLSLNANLTALDCANNQLERLNVANNNNVNISSNSFDATNNNLQCIEVDDPNQATQNWNSQIDAWSYFSSNCIALNNQNINTELFDELMIYPNPVDEVLTVDLGEAYEMVSVEIYNTLGALVMSQNFKEMTKENINLSLNAGVYTIRVNTSKGQSSITRLVKK